MQRLKLSINLFEKNGVWGEAPSKVAGAAAPDNKPGTDAGRVCQKALSKDAYKWSNRVGARCTDHTRPQMQRCRAYQAYTTLHRGEGVGVTGKDA